MIEHLVCQWKPPSFRRAFAALVAAGSFLAAGALVASGPARAAQSAVTPAQPADDLSLKTILVAFEWPRFGVTVLSGTGRKRLTLKARQDAPDLWRGEARIRSREAFFAPAVHPNGERLAYLRCRNLKLDETGSGSPESCALLEMHLDSGDTRTLFEPPQGTLLDAPEWSPRGDRLALFVGRDLAVLDPASRSILRRVPNVKRRAADPARGSVRDYVRWSADGRQIFLNANASCWAANDLPTCKVFAQIDPDDGKVEWLDTTWPDLEVREGRCLFHDWVTDLRGNKTPVPAAPPDSPAVRALLGSIENPVYQPVYSSGRRYYFYTTYRHGYLSKTRIEGYDTQTKTAFQVRALGLALYGE